MPSDTEMNIQRPRAPTSFGLKEEHKKKILVNFRYLKQELVPQQIVHCFIQDKIMDEHDLEDIQSERTRRARADRFLGILIRSHPEAYDKFLVHLKANNVRQDYICEQLSKPPVVPGITLTQTIIQLPSIFYYFLSFPIAAVKTVVNKFA